MGRQELGMDWLSCVCVCVIDLHVEGSELEKAPMVHMVCFGARPGTRCKAGFPGLQTSQPQLDRPHLAPRHRQLHSVWSVQSWNMDTVSLEGRPQMLATSRNFPSEPDWATCLLLGAHPRGNHFALGLKPTSPTGFCGQLDS